MVCPISSNVVYVCLMLRMINNLSTRSLGISSALLGLSLLFTSCGLVDSPEDEPTTSNDVREYYFTLDVPSDHHAYYTYVIDAGNPVMDTLRMEMEGKADSWAAPSAGVQVYECAWKFGPNPYADYYYAMSKDTAYFLGYQSKPDTWQDLVGPLAVGKSWKFNTPQSTDPMVATVVRMGAQVAVRGKLYKDVVEVKYQSADVTKTKWFAKGIGTVYSHVENHLTGADTEQTLLARSED
jgi:hypothetical protein